MANDMYLGTREDVRAGGACARLKSNVAESVSFTRRLRIPTARTIRFELVVLIQQQPVRPNKKD